MRIAIVGGALRGMEAAYLAKKAGYETIVIDKRSDAPAFSLADNSFILDPETHETYAMKIFKDCDAVLPACENLSLLAELDDMLRYSGIPLLFDMGAYLISSSKNASNGMMELMNIPMPKKWQHCGFPIIVKPSSHSGSTGVTVAKNQKEIDEGLEEILRLGDEPVIQEFVHGKNVSTEVIGNGSEFRSFVVSEMIPGEDYSCKRVICHPGVLDKEDEDDLSAMAELIAERLDLNALMAVQAMNTEKGLKVLEIDARIPSQTPSAVLAATGINLLEELVKSRLGGTIRKGKNGASSYEHFLVKDGKLMTCSEKEFAEIRNPEIVRGLFGADEMISDFQKDADTWRCAMINSAGSEWELERKRARCIESIINECGIDEFIDTFPKRV